MTDYIVSVDNEECNPLANACSLSGRVNGTQCAAKVKLTDLEPLDIRNAKLAKQKALVLAYLNKTQQPVSGGEKVSI